MKWLIFLFTCSLSVVFAFGQKSLSPDKEEMNSTCIFKPTFSKSQIFSSFPFNRAAQIKLVFFERAGIQSTGMIQKQGHKTKDGNYVVDSVTIDSSSWKETVILPKDQYLPLGNLVFNYFFRGDVTQVEIVMCYMPHNAIVLYDADGKLSAVIEICFLCHRAFTYPAGWDLGEPCSTKIELYRQFFTRNGLTRGTKAEED